MLRLLILSSMLLAACGAEQLALTAGDIDIPPPVPGANMGAAYLTLSNNTAQEITIDKVASPELKSVEMHESVLEEGVSRMLRLPQVTIAPRQSVVFERGAKHLMLRYPTETPQQVTLQFYAGDAMLLSVDVLLKE
ncbi:MAG: copper chaperone PCu(A)C [Woeseiaceae bacterium]